MKQKRGFTLVELLVVISIIALLLSVLMPALNKAREQAKILICQANCKQVGLIINVYRADNNGAVPIVLNRWAENASGAGNIHAKNNYISLGLRDYSESTKNLKSKSNGSLDPDGTWALQFDGRVKDYVTKYLPKFYVCPFVRGKAVTTRYVGDGTATFGASSQSYLKYKYTGQFETFSTWAWGRQQGEDLSLIGTAYSTHPLGLPNGRPKFTSFPWNCNVDNGSTGSGKMDVEHNMVWGSKKHIRPSNSTTGRLPLTYSSMSEVAVTYCCMGENYDWGKSIFNFGSHRKKNVGGTTAILADGHVEWVPGSQIGWQ